MARALRDTNDYRAKHTMSLASLSTIRQGLSQYDRSGLAIPAVVILIIAMLVLPLPPLLLLLCTVTLAVLCR